MTLWLNMLKNLPSLLVKTTMATKTNMLSSWKKSACGTVAITMAITAASPAA